MNKLKELQSELSNIQVLYVEDEIEVREATMNFLKKIFSNIDSANDGESGLKAFKEKAYALVITDLKMPKMNGKEMLEEIRSLNKDTVLMVMTASDSNQDATETVCDSYMKKPTMLMDFLEELDSLKNQILNTIK